VQNENTNEVETQYYI